MVLGLSHQFSGAFSLKMPQSVPVQNQLLKGGRGGYSCSKDLFLLIAIM